LGSAAHHGGEYGYLVAHLQPGSHAVQRLDVPAVDQYVHVLSDLARLVEDLVPEIGRSAEKLGQDDDRPIFQAVQNPPGMLNLDACTRVMIRAGNPPVAAPDPTEISVSPSADDTGPRSPAARPVISIRDAIFATPFIMIRSSSCPSHAARSRPPPRYSHPEVLRRDISIRMDLCIFKLTDI